MAENDFTKPGFWPHFVGFSRKNSKKHRVHYIFFSEDPQNSLNQIFRIGPDPVSSENREIAIVCVFPIRKWDLLTLGVWGAFPS